MRRKMKLGLKLRTESWGKTAGVLFSPLPWLSLFYLRSGGLLPSNRLMYSQLLTTCCDFNGRGQGHSSLIGQFVLDMLSFSIACIHFFITDDKSLRSTAAGSCSLIKVINVRFGWVGNTMSGTHISPFRGCEKLTYD